MKALIIIDWQKEWTRKDSDYFVGSDLVVETKKLNELIGFARKNGFKLLFVKHVELSGQNFSKESGSADFVDGLEVHENDTIIEKNKISVFYKTGIEKYLAGVDEVYVAGILTNLCVRSAVSDLYDRDYSVVLVEDCCVAMSKDMHNFTLRDFSETRPEVRIVRFDNIF